MRKREEYERVRRGEEEEAEASRKAREEGCLTGKG